MKLQPQISRLCRDLDAELNNFALGERFYSVREIMEKFGANRRVIDGAFAQLERDGLIRREPGVGIFSGVDRKPSARNILFVSPEWPSENNGAMFRAVQEYLAANPHYQLKRFFFDSASAVLPQLPPGPCDAALVIRNAGALDPEDLRMIGNTPYHTVFLNTLLEDCPVSTAMFDNVHGGVLAAEYLTRRGHRRLRVLVGEPWGGDIRTRVSTFVTASSAFGAETEVIDSHTCVGNSSSQLAYDDLSAYLKRNGCDFTALFVVSDGAVPGALTALREADIPVPETVSVIGCDGLEAGAFFCPPLTTVGGDRELLTAAMFDELDRIFRGEKSFMRLSMPMRVIERESVRALPSAFPWKQTSPTGTFPIN